MNANKNWGGKRPNAGRTKLANRQHIVLSKDAAKSLWLLTKHQRALLGKPELTQEDIVTRLIEDAWREIEAGYEDAARLLGEVGIL